MGKLASLRVLPTCKKVAASGLVGMLRTGQNITYTKSKQYQDIAIRNISVRFEDV